MKERKKTDLNRSEWKTELMKSIPIQENGSDCGVFTCKFAEYLSRDAKLTFKQKDMNYYRERMIYEIVKQELLYP
jgi:sentrin-specific protease 1